MTTDDPSHPRTPHLAVTPTHPDRRPRRPEYLTELSGDHPWVWSR